jgi:hypothetical protein
MRVPNHDCPLCHGTGEREHDDMTFLIPCNCFHEVSDEVDPLLLAIINELGGEEIEYEADPRQIKIKKV